MSIQDEIHRLACLEAIGNLEFYVVGQDSMTNRGSKLGCRIPMDDFGLDDAALKSFCEDLNTAIKRVTLDRRRYLLEVTRNHLRVTNIEE